ncbi:TlpA disulfide reductase family protein [Massilia sp. YIM B02769]|uniref:TlpA disulfide reductase family protein n=1 Tax=Massilia sp. YIM B02769 TaxID=3050129 RepID=UPI0025B69D18|nr:TlpA disulfide reductase family protein [Massilia sp. YIM B02769]MDN4058405.1 TlpA disulfide reductase family protein [Massilia sp. YIM B02769]
MPLDAINIGPVAMPVRVLAALAAVLAANLAALWWRRRRGIDTDPALWHMLLWGFLAARAAFVLKHFASYRDDPLSMLDIRDGGFVAFAGLLVAFAIGFEHVRRHGALRRPLMSAALLGVAVWAGATFAAYATGPAAPPLPDIALKRLDGSDVALRSLSGKPMVVNLWATWCPPCRREMPALGRAQAADPGVAFVFVNGTEDAATIGRYLDDAGLKLGNMLVDPALALARATGVQGYPTTLFYDRDGKLVARHMGELSPAQLQEQMAALR